MRPTRFLWLLLLAGSLLGACGSPEIDRPPVPAPPPEIVLTLKEYSYTFSTKQIPAGRVVFRIVNQGDQIHQPALVNLPEDLPPLEEQLQGEKRRVVNPEANNNGVRPGVTNAFAVDLQAGKRYGFVCYARTADDKAHNQMGMAWEFRPPGPAVASPSTTQPAQ